MGELRDYIIVGRTPKCHPDISGEVIDYYWVFAKNYYRWLSLYKKKGKKNAKKKGPRGHIKRQPYHKAAAYIL